MTNLHFLKTSIFAIGTSFILSGCAELQQTLKNTQQTKQSQTLQHNTKAPTGNQVVKVKKRPNNGKKVVKDGIEYPEQFSVDENGNLEFTPTISNKAIRDLNKITEKHGVTIQGY